MREQTGEGSTRGQEALRTRNLRLIELRKTGRMDWPKVYDRQAACLLTLLNHEENNSKEERQEK
jgi:hypothetical protein